MLLHRSRSRILSVRHQSGAAVLVFLLLVVVSASTLLLNRLNAAMRLSVYSPVTSDALQEAKTALMSWAVNHPFNPGTMPMPDRNGDSNYDGDADCFNGTITNTLLLGKVPWRGMPSPCKDAADLSGLSVFATDKYGEHLWYGVSKNLVYESPEYPFISPGLIHKSTDWITVRDANGNILSDRVAFVVIAPGPALAPYSNCDGLNYSGQDRSATAPAASNYLDSVTIGATTYSNADTDQDFIMYPNSIITSGSSTQEECDQFNDQLVFVTIDELMESVSRRVLNEAANALTAYHNDTSGALPWLAPFADPKSDSRALYGEASAAGSNLTDTTVDFTDWGIANGDIVWNLSDGSRGIVTGIAANTLTIGAGLKFGSNNTFALDDEYYVEIKALASRLASSASSGSSGLVLEDTNRDFDELGIKPGDIVDNLDDGSSGVVAEVDGDELTVTGLTGGTDNDFDSNDDYRIRTNRGRATANTDANGLTLEDTTADFTTMGILSGDIVTNISDGSTGRVTTVNSATQLTVSSLTLGTANAFANNDYYSISRSNPVISTRSGMLPLHRLGETFPSGFTVDWNLAGGTIATTLATDSTYTTALSGYAGSSSSYSGTITVNETNAACQWLTNNFIRCKGLYEDSTAAFLAGTATTGSSSLALRDSTKNFSTIGTKRGDKVRNITDGTTGIVYSTTSTQLTLVNINGSTNVNIGVGDSYQIDLATSSFTFVAATNSTSNAWQYRVYYPGTVNESLMAAGDTIENTNGSQSVGRITSINTASNYIVYTPLQSNPTGGYADIYDGETVRIKYNFVSKRQYQFDVTLKGTAAESTISDIRNRAVCIGYDSTCTTASNNASLKGDASTAWVTIRDYEGTTQVGQATNTISTGGLSFRSLKLGGLRYQINEDAGDIPDWFVRNKWHQYVMVAYNDGDAPGGTTCTAGTNCMTLNIRDAANAIVSSKTNVRALVMLSRDELAGQSWSDAAVSDYYDEAENTDADDVFDRQPDSASYNDLIRMAASCPTNTAKLCWSN